MIKKITIIIHGPLDEKFLKKNLTVISRQIPHAQVIISTYLSEWGRVENIIWEYSFYKTLKIISVGSKDIFNAGFYNVNRQINLVNAALDKVEHDSYVIKVRMDQVINYKKLLNIIEKFHIGIADKIITSNCYTRADRWYHPSDMFLAGSYLALRHYYPHSFFCDTHMDSTLAIRELVRSQAVKDFYAFWPESRLFIHFLTSRGEEIKGTKEDSIEKLKENIFLVNSWDISLKWRKFFNGRVVVLPYTLFMPPFPGGPVERAVCYKASDLNSVISVASERYYTFMASCLYRSGLFRFNNLLLNFRGSILSICRKLFVILLKFTPPVLHNMIIKTGRVFYNMIK